MKSNQISVILVHTAPFLVEYKSINNDIETFQKEINCNFFDVKSFTINDKKYTFYYDESGLYTKKTVPSLINKNGDILLVNNFFICKEKQTEEGKIASSLTADEAKAIMSSHFYNLNTTDGVIKVMMI